MPRLLSALVYFLSTPLVPFGFIAYMELRNDHVLGYVDAIVVPFVLAGGLFYLLHRYVFAKFVRSPYTLRDHLVQCAAYYVLLAVEVERLLTGYPAYRHGLEYFWWLFTAYISVIAIGVNLLFLFTQRRRAAAAITA